MKDTYTPLNSRPHLHFTAPKNWMNDPNGLVFHKGLYHLFYQHNPHAPVWGDIHWGHAVSADCLSWEDRGLSIAPFGKVRQIYSGCGVADVGNTSDLFAGEGGVVLLFTGVRGGAGGKTVEEQYLGYLDEASGRVILPFQEPVIANPGLSDFRDPKVAAVPESGLWLMVIACGNHLRFYGSRNLKDWKETSRLTPPGLSEGQILECPNLFPLSSEKGENLWVLSVSILEKPERVSSSAYMTGRLGDSGFVPDHEGLRVLDWGHDFYAPQVWESAPEGIMIGWMNNWAYAEAFPCKDWNGIFSCPRALSLRTEGTATVLSQKPLDTLNTLRREELNAEAGRDRVEFALDSEGVYDMSVCAETKDLSSMTLSILEAGKRSFTILIDPRNRRILLDREGVSFDAMREKNLTRKTIPIDIGEGFDIRLILDLWTAEIFLLKGTVAISELLRWERYPDRIRLSWTGTAGTVHAECWKLGRTMRSAHERLASHSNQEEE
jgi:fructan beta-fructosidase